MPLSDLSETIAYLHSVPLPRVCSPVHRVGDGSAVPQGIHVGLWEPCAGDFVPNRDPVVTQIVLTGKDLQVPT